MDPSHTPTVISELVLFLERVRRTAAALDAALQEASRLRGGPCESPDAKETAA